MRASSIRHTIVIIHILLALLFSAYFVVENSLAQEDNGGAGSATIFIPILAHPYEPPNLLPIIKADQTSTYTVYWESDTTAYYVLQESQTPTFSDVTVVYEGFATQWSVPQPGKRPGVYYYRIGSMANGTIPVWSNVQSVTIHPLYVGLNLRWDGVGYLNIGGYYQPGSHQTMYLANLTTPDSVRIQNHHWYDPNPLGFEESKWDTFYSVSTGRFLASSVPDDPAWKWGYSWIVPYDLTFQDGQTVQIGGQSFLVTGPHSGYTAFGQPVQYWEMVNQERFLFFDDGSEWTQYVHSGDITLRYDAGATRLLLHDDILRRYYQNNNLSDYTVQYIVNLTEAGSFPSAQGQPTLSTAHGSTPGISVDLPVLPGLDARPALTEEHIEFKIIP